MTYNIWNKWDKLKTVMLGTCHPLEFYDKSLDPKVKNAIDLAYSRIYKFHSLQKFKNISYIDKLKNKLEYKYLPIESVAIYFTKSYTRSDKL